MDNLLKLLKQDAMLTNDELAAMLDSNPSEIAAKIEEFERAGIIKGYSAIIDEELADKDSVTAYIELKVTPKPDLGFDDIAGIIMQYPEVDSVFLMSGSYDLSVLVSGTNLRDIALFVAQRLSALDSVISTATHFVLKRYKEKGIIFTQDNIDERGLVSP